MEFERTVIVCGHYGCGKTNLSVNLALNFARGGEQVGVADLDIVNPYFRTADFTGLFEERGIAPLMPQFANTNVDLPVMPAQLRAAVSAGGRVIIDVGGDPDGAVALGSLADLLSSRRYTMLYVVNRFRYLEPDPAEELELLRATEAASRLRVTHIVSNGNLGCETAKEHIRLGRDFAQETAKLAGLPVAFCTAPLALAASLPKPDIYPVDIFVKKPWE